MVNCWWMTGDEVLGHMYQISMTTEEKIMLWSRTMNNQDDLCGKLRWYVGILHVCNLHNKYYGVQPIDGIEFTKN